jgi:hypothetical protein
MLLDEPTQGMGHEDVDRVTQLIKKVSANRTVLMVEHNMNVVGSIADTITVLQRGQVIAEGPYAEVSRNPQVLEAYMGSEDEELQGAHGHCMSTSNVEFLRLTDVHAWYGESHILHGVDLDVNRAKSSRCWAATAPAAPPRCAPSWAWSARTGSIMINGARPCAWRRTDRAPGHRLLPGRARHLRQPDVRGKPDAAAARWPPAA